MTLTANPGTTWGPEPVTFAYQWLRAGVAISGATASTYTPTADDLGKTLTVQVAGSKNGWIGGATKTYAATTVVLQGTLTAATPTITGTVKTGSVLTVAPGAWGPAPVTFAYQWLRSGTPISGATASTYTLLAADEGAPITATVTASKAGYATASATATAPGWQLTVGTPTIAGTSSVGTTLTASPGTWGPGAVTFAYQWLRAGTAIGRATGATYVVGAADDGQPITVRVTGSRSGFASATAVSAAAIRPLITATPTITGTVAVGSTVTAVPGAWGPAPVTLTYQWLRSGTAISGATASTYALVSADQGLPITVRVTGSKAGYATASTTSSAGLWALTTATPTITGTPTVGATLTAQPGTWAPAPVTLTYQWKRAGVAIPGATSATYTIGSDDLGKTLTVTVTGSKSGYATATATSAATATVGSGRLVPAKPVISATAKVGVTLTATPGAWAPAPVTLTYQWNRAGVAIAGATSATYVPVAADLDKTLTVTVTGSKSGYASASATSAATAAVAAGTLTTGTPTITGTLTVGSTLTVSTGTWGPSPVTITCQWKRDGTAIAGATGTTYTLVAADQGHQITVTCTGSKAGYTTVGTTSASGQWTLTAGTPTITGTLAVGSVLTAVPGTWGPAPVTLSYQWLRGTTAISGATNATYTATTADQGQLMSVRVTGTKTNYGTQVRTSAARTGWPLTKATPTISGTAKVGMTLTAVPGTWGPAPVTLTYQWKRSGTAITGATGSTYALVATDLGKTLTVTVTVSKTNFTTVSLTSVATGTVAAGTLTANLPAVSGNLTTGSVLSANAGTWGPAPVTLTYQWLRDDAVISGATGATFTMRAADVGHEMSVRVTGTKAGYATLSVTGSRVFVAGGMKVGNQLTFRSGSWQPAPVALSVQWYRSGVAISGAKSIYYTLTTADKGKAITVKATLSKTGYGSASVSAAAPSW